MIRAVFFDLDNTLYDQRSFFRQVFAKVVCYITQQFDIDEVKVEQKIWEIFDARGSLYTGLFNDLLQYFDLPSTELKSILREYHSTPLVDLEVYADAKRFLASVKGQYKIGIITNGTPQTQRKKIVCLGLEDVFDIYVCTAEFDAPKPSSTCFVHAAKALNVETTDSIYVGDNPFVDFQGAKKAGMYTVRLLRGEFQNISPQHCENVDKTICSYEELRPIVENW